MDRTERKTMTNPSDEFVAALGGAGVGRLVPRGLFEVLGNDRRKFLHNFCTNDIKNLKQGEGCEAIMASVQGKVLAYLVVQVGEESLWIEADRKRREIISKHLERYVVMDDVKIVDRTEDFSILLVSGPRAETVLLNLGLKVSPSPDWGHGAGKIGPYEVVWQRTGWTNQTNWTLRVADNEETPLIDLLVEAGAIRLSAEAIEALRIVAGFPREGIDFSEENLAQELARTEKCISFRKGCYLGQEPIARIDALGHVNRELHRVVLKGEQKPEIGVTISDPSSEKVVGKVTSVSSFPLQGEWPALAMLKKEVCSAGIVLGSEHWDIRFDG